LAEQKSELEAFLYQRVYRHPRLIAVRTQASTRLQAMFAGYLAQPELMPERFRRRAQTVGMERAVGDYIAGMTDRYCDQQYQTHFHS
jgi:dGTPase